MSNLVERLRAWAVYDCGQPGNPLLMLEAADEIERLAALRALGVTLPDDWEQVAGYCGFRVDEHGGYADTRILILAGDEAMHTAHKHEPLPVFVRRGAPE